MRALENNLQFCLPVENLFSIGTRLPSYPLELATLGTSVNSYWGINYKQIEQILFSRQQLVHYRYMYTRGSHSLGLLLHPTLKMTSPTAAPSFMHIAQQAKCYRIGIRCKLPASNFANKRANSPKVLMRHRKERVATHPSSQ